MHFGKLFQKKNLLSNNDNVFSCLDAWLFGNIHAAMYAKVRAVRRPIMLADSAVHVFHFGFSLIIQYDHKIIPTTKILETLFVWCVNFQSNCQTYFIQFLLINLHNIGRPVENESIWA